MAPPRRDSVRRRSALGSAVRSDGARSRLPGRACPRRAALAALGPGNGMINRGCLGPVSPRWGVRPPGRRGTGVPAGRGRGVPWEGARYPAEWAQGVRRMGHGSARRYGYAHRKIRTWWVPRVATGLVQCWRCGIVIRADEQWHLGHDDGNAQVYKGPEHIDCNCGTKSRDRHGGDPLPRVDKWWEE